MSASRPAEAPPGAVVRAALFALPCGVLGVAAFMAVCAVLAWGKGKVLDFPDWAPTVTLGVPALGVALVGALALRSLVLVTRRPVRFSVLQTPVALLVVLGTLLAFVSMAYASAREQTYRDLLQDGEPVVSAGAFVAFGLVLGILLLMGLTWSTGLYVNAVESNAGTRFDKRAGEPDAVGALLKEERK